VSKGGIAGPCALAHRQRLPELAVPLKDGWDSRDADREPGIARAVIARRRVRWSIVAAFIVAGCETQTAMVTHQAPTAVAPREVRIEPCRNRTDFTGRDVGAEATRLLSDKLAAGGVFVLSPDGPLVLTCDVERFVEGSALKRWLAPGWGATQAQVAVVLWEQPGQKLLTTLRSQGAIRSGGLYTIGADRYILGVAVEEVVQQLHEWAAVAGRRR
jgi:hypothetical protein